jgi:hypothetical protein
VQVLPLGAVLSALPVDLAIGKLLIFSTLFGLEDELMTIAAGLSIQSPFVRVDAGSSEATNRQQLVSEEGDPFTLLNVYDEWIRVKAARDNTKKWCVLTLVLLLVCIYVPRCPHTCVCVCVCMCIHVSCAHPRLLPPYPHTTTYVYICASVSSYLYMCVCVYVYACVLILVCICVCIGASGTAWRSRGCMR